MPPCAPLMLSGRGKTMGDIDVHGPGILGDVHPTYDIQEVRRLMGQSRLAGIKAGLEAAAKRVGRDRMRYCKGGSNHSIPCCSEYGAWTKLAWRCACDTEAERIRGIDPATVAGG